jgi:hypothetical protein
MISNLQDANHYAFKTLGLEKYNMAQRIDVSEGGGIFVDSNDETITASVGEQEVFLVKGVKIKTDEQSNSQQAVNES